MRIPLFHKIMLLSTLTLSSSLALGYVLLEHRILQETRAQIENDNILLVGELSRSLSLPLLKGDKLLIEDHLGVFERSKGVLGIAVLDRTGQSIAFLNNLHGQGLDSFEDPSPAPSLNPAGPILFQHIRKRHMYRLIAPVNFQSVRVGEVRLYLSDAPYTEVRNRIAHSFILLGGISLLIATAGSLFLSGYISRPIRVLRDAVSKIPQGTFEPVQSGNSGDETADLVESFNQMVNDLRHKDLLEKALGRYVSREVAEHLISHPELIHLGGFRQEVVILFADIRNFTELSERLRPEEVVQILNDYFNSFIDDIFSFGGSVNNIMGDGIMVVFGIPEVHQDHPQSALLCALRMRQNIHTLSGLRIKEGKPTVDFGIGLHLGEGVVGHIGSKNRMEYTVVGAPVNMAYRIQEAAAAGEILVSDDLLARCQSGLFRLSQSRSIHPKGVREGLLVHSLEGSGPCPPEKLI